MVLIRAEWGAGNYPTGTQPTQPTYHYLGDNGQIVTTTDPTTFVAFSNGGSGVVDTSTNQIVASGTQIDMNGNPVTQTGGTYNPSTGASSVSASIAAATANAQGGASASAPTPSTTSLAGSLFSGPALPILLVLGVAAVMIYESRKPTTRL